MVDDKVQGGGALLLRKSHIRRTRQMDVPANALFQARIAIDDNAYST